MARRGQFQHVFTFIMMMVIAGVVLLLGYIFISKILDYQCTAERTNFITDLKKDLRSYSAAGTIQTAEFAAPCKAQALCFVAGDSYTKNLDGTYAAAAGFDSSNTIIKNAVKDAGNSPDSVFLVYDTKTTEGLHIFSQGIRLAGNTVPPAPPYTAPLCVNATGGSFRVGFEGRGLTVLLTDASS